MESIKNQKEPVDRFAAAQDKPGRFRAVDPYEELWWGQSCTPPTIIAKYLGFEHHVRQWAATIYTWYHPHPTTSVKEHLYAQ